MTGARLDGLVSAAAAELDTLLAAADAELAARYPGERPGGPARQPVHTAYVPADRLTAGTTRHWGALALAALEEFAAGDAEFAAAMRLPPELAAKVRPLVLAKLATEPVEDLRIDFEDGYGAPGDADEDAAADAAAAALAGAMAAATAPPFSGLRCKSLEPATRRRAIATTGRFLAAMADQGGLPGDFVITLPKVTSAAQVTAMAALCGRLEDALGLPPGRLVFEVQVETPQAILGPDGAATVARCVHAAGGRLTGLHFGTYDYGAGLQIAPGYQGMDHPAADHARAVMQVAAAGTGVRLSDGSTNVLPAGDRDSVRAGWQLHARLVRRSLERGFYQGWDLHPAQLASRYAATYAFFLAGLPEAAARLRHFTERSRDGREEPATGRALAGFLARAVDCGAVPEAGLTGLTGLDRQALARLRRTGHA